MKDKNAFFSSKNTIDRITDADVENTPDYLEAIKTFTEITNKSVYVVDYQKQGFEYVSDNPLFLLMRLHCRGGKRNGVRLLF